MAAGCCYCWRRRGLRLGCTGLLRDEPFGLGAVAMMVLLGESLKVIPWSEPTGEAIDVALVQPGLKQDLRWRAENIDLIKDTYWQLTETVADTPIIIWPEAAIPMYYKHIEGFYDNLNDNILGEGTTHSCRSVLSRR